MAHATRLRVYAVLVAESRDWRDIRGLIREFHFCPLPPTLELFLFVDRRRAGADNTLSTVSSFSSDVWREKLLPHHIEPIDYFSDGFRRSRFTHGIALYSLRWKSAVRQRTNYCSFLNEKARTGSVRWDIKKRSESYNPVVISAAAGF